MISTTGQSALDLTSRQRREHDLLVPSAETMPDILEAGRSIKPPSEIGGILIPSKSAGLFTVHHKLSQSRAESLLRLTSQMFIDAGIPPPVHQKTAQKGKRLRPGRCGRMKEDYLSRKAFGIRQPRQVNATRFLVGALPRWHE
jgi:hypothetical protein